MLNKTKDLNAVDANGVYTQTQIEYHDEIINICISGDGDATVKAIKTEILIDNHIANFDLLTNLSNSKQFDLNFYDVEIKNNSKNDEKISIIKNFKLLIKFCLMSLKGISMESQPINNNIFQVNKNHN